MSNRTTRPSFARRRGTRPSPAAASAPLLAAAVLAGGTFGAPAAHAAGPDKDAREGSHIRGEVPAPTTDALSTDTATAEAGVPASAGATTAVRTLNGPGFISGTVTEAVPVSHGGRTYQVREGDTLIGIAKKHGVSVPALLDLNSLSSNAFIHPGQVLSLPEKSGTPAPAGHVVKSGETLGGIANRYDTSVEALQKANAMGVSTIIRIGELLSLSGSGATSTRPAEETPDDSELPKLPKSFEGREYPDDVHTAARVNKDTLQSMDLPSKSEIKDMVRDTASRMGVDPALALALAEQESGFQQGVVSPANAIGVMQVIPTSGEWAEMLTGETIDLLDTQDNITAGIAIIRWQLQNAEGEQQALAGYYQGLGSVRDNGMYSDTKRYVTNVQVLKERYRSESDR